MKTYFVDKNITEICDEMIEKFSGHVKTNEVRIILLTMWKYCRKNEWNDSYGLKHEVERIVGFAEADDRYCTEFVVKNILFEMYLNDMVEIGLWQGVNERPRIRKIYDDELKKVIGEENKNICYKLRDNININI